MRIDLAVRLLQWIDMNGTASPTVIVLIREAIKLIEPTAALNENYRLNKEWSLPPESTAWPLLQECKEQGK